MHWIIRRYYEPAHGSLPDVARLLLLLMQVPLITEYVVIPACPTMQLSTVQPGPPGLVRNSIRSVAAIKLQERGITTRLSTASAPDRKQLEQFIHAVFRNVYDADVTHFMPRLLSLHDPEARVLAVCGLRSARNERLFLETYLDQPIDTVLSERIGSTVSRDNIVEIGNLAVAELGMARRLLQEVIHYLSATDVQWAVFTAIPMLRNSLGKLNVQLEVLGDASPDRLSEDERPHWGSYYQQHPQVMAVRRLPDRLTRL